MSEEKFSHIKKCLQEVRYETGASVVLIADESGRALIYTGTEEPHTISLLAALSAAGLSALQEIIMTSFRLPQAADEQMLMLEVPQGEILLLSKPPLVFLLVFSDKTRLGMARLLLKRLAKEADWRAILHQPEDQVQQALNQVKEEVFSSEDKLENDLFHTLWQRGE